MKKFIASGMSHTWGYENNTHTHTGLWQHHIHGAMKIPHIHTRLHGAMKTLHTWSYEDTIVRQMLLKVLPGEKSRQERIKREVWGGEREFEWNWLLWKLWPVCFMWLSFNSEAGKGKVDSASRRGHEVSHLTWKSLVKGSGETLPPLSWDNRVSVVMKVSPQGGRSLSLWAAFPISTLLWILGGWWWGHHQMMLLLPFWRWCDGPVMGAEQNWSS